MSIKKRGTKEEVYNGLAYQTPGGLFKGDLFMNDKGKIISKAKHEQGKKAYQNLASYKNSKKPKEETPAAPEPAEKEEALSSPEPIQEIQPAPSNPIAPVGVQEEKKEEAGAEAAPVKAKRARKAKSAAAPAP